MSKRRTKAKKSATKKKKIVSKFTVNEMPLVKTTSEKSITLDAVEAMSSSDEGSVEKQNSKWNKEADSLRKSIASGAFDKILSERNEDEDSDSIEEVDLGEDDSEQSGGEVNSESETKDRVVAKTSIEKNEAEEEGSEGETDIDGGNKTTEAKSDHDTDEPSNMETESTEENSSEDKAMKNFVAAEEDLIGEKEEDEGNEMTEARSENSEDSDDDPDESNNMESTSSSSTALLMVTEELKNSKKNLPWIETFDIIPSDPLPFGTKDDETGIKIDVHDDLKREVIFHDLALQAVLEARKKCEELAVPFSRPEDYFAEMVKTDDHMARVKDRLIFETKKMDAVAQRKSKKEQLLRSKEKHANKIAENSRRKKENLKAIENWSQAAASNRGSGLNDDDDSKFLTNVSRRQNGIWKDRDGSLRTGPNSKRQGANKKYGFGGKRGRFKQNDAQSMNDMSAYNPRGNFAGGMKGVGGKRPGKRARDAARSRSRGA